MATHYTLDATLRTVTGKKVRNLRLDGFVPGVIYGHGFENVQIQMPYNIFEKTARQAGTSNVIALHVGNESCDVLMHELMLNPVTNRMAHVDFIRIRKGEKITTHVPLHLIGESPLVKTMGGVLLQELHELGIKCLPAELVDHIDVDVSAITEFGEPLHVKSLQIPKGIEVLNDENLVVAIVAAPKKEEEVLPEASLIPEELKKQQEEVAAKIDDKKDKKKDKKD